jgi:hypothetical protein
VTDGGGPTAGRRPADGAREEPAVRRPGFVVLGARSLVPETNLVRPPPDRLTHELVADEPYHLDRPGRGRAPDGVLPAGTPVAVPDGGDDRSGDDRSGDDRCRVVTATGLAVDVRRANLRELPAGT